MSIIDKIKDLLGIEHHPIGSVRIVELGSGEFEVQTWNYGWDWPCDRTPPHWQCVILVKDGKTYCCRTDTLDGAIKLRELYLEKKRKEAARKFIKRIVE